MSPEEIKALIATEVAKQLKDLPCNHTMILDGRGDRSQVFFNLANAYTQCSKCGKRFRT